MDIWKAQEMVVESLPEHWELWSTGSAGEDHEWRATFHPDVALEMHFGKEAGEPFEEEWTKKFLDSSVRPFSLEATYGGSRILEAMFVSVDGGRLRLPLPMPRVHDTQGHVEFRVRRQNVEVGRLVNDLTVYQGHDYDDSIVRAGFVITD